MVFLVQSLTFYNSQSQETAILVPVTQPLQVSSPSDTLCSNIRGEFAARTAQLLTSPIQEIVQKRRRMRTKPKNPDFSIKGPSIRKFRKFSFQELQVATNDFSERNELGRGGFGFVYRGTLVDGSAVAVKKLANSSTQAELKFQRLVEVSTVAVKRLAESTYQGESEFQREIEVSSVATHRNLLQLYGYCMTSRERLLVYPFMANGSLESVITGSLPSQPPEPLNWPMRKKIALAVARGLAYLHEYCHAQIIHRDLKPSNILLGDNFEPAISDCGLARFIVRPREQQREAMQVADFEDKSDQHHAITSSIYGTCGYMAPEYIETGQYSEMTDVYAFGITILQLTSGCQSNLWNGKVMYLSLPEWVRELAKNDQIKRVIDPNLRGEQHVEDQAQNLNKLGLLCVRNQPASRPKMSEVIRMLEGTAIVEGWEECCQEPNYLD